MKTKKFSKKLTLNKKTVVSLNRVEMRDVHGGGDKPPESIISPGGCIGTTNQAVGC